MLPRAYRAGGATGGTPRAGDIGDGQLHCPVPHDPLPASHIPAETLTACILAGGLGTRLRPLTDDVPKPMVPVAGKPFLWHQLSRLAAGGVTDFVLATGYRHEQVEAFFGDGAAFGWTVRYSVETTPLGTGGALARALPLLGERFLAMNGDTFLDVDLAAFRADPWAAEGFDGVLGALPMDDCARYGRIESDGRRLTRFTEKSPGSGTINVGLYALHRRLLDGRTGAFSLEHDVLPGAKLAVHPIAGDFIDIGTFDSLASLRARMEHA